MWLCQGVKNIEGSQIEGLPTNRKEAFFLT